MTADQHRRVRLVWVIAAAVELVVSLGAIRWPWIGIYLAPRGGWIWCLIPAGYHHGWLRAHRVAVVAIDVPGDRESPPDASDGT